MNLEGFCLWMADLLSLSQIILVKESVFKKKSKIFSCAQPKAETDAIRELAAILQSDGRAYLGILVWLGK